jgi:PKHD-type hydroxylase
MKTSYFIEPKESNFSNYYFFEKGLQDEEVRRITSESESIPSQEAIINDDYRKKSIRTSSIKWLPKDTNWQWIYNKLSDLISIANHSMWNLELTTMHDNIQYTEYYASEDGHYDWHMDIGSGETSFRKVSIVVQMSDPTEYEGGDLQIWLGGTSTLTVPKGLGNVAVFPSFYMHRVSPVTSGTRKSLVMWAGGTPYR